jgi:hypothetical protein
MTPDPDARSQTNPHADPLSPPGRGENESRWENEGGAGGPAGFAAPGRSAGGHERAERAAPRPEGTPAQEAAQDVRQDRIMTAESPDGRPPTHGQRRREWWWLGGGLTLLLAGGIVYAAVTGAQAITVVLVVVFLAALVAAAVPVWGAGLLRGREQRSAQRGAARGRDGPPAPRSGRSGEK